MAWAVFFVSFRRMRSHLKFQEDYYNESDLESVSDESDDFNKKKRYSSSC